jgi:hypothetical protein
MFYRLQQHLLRTFFNTSVRAVRGTPVVRLDPQSALLAASQLCHRDVFMYLVALKSFARFVRLARVVVLDDGSLTVADRDLLARHVEGIEVVQTSAVESADCPRGGTWERLLWISEAIERTFVVQIDADTLTLREPREVLQCVHDNVSFTLGTKLGRRVVAAAEACASEQKYAQQHPEDGHVQTQAEKVFDRLPGVANLKYVRGNSGFAGYAKGAFRREDVEGFSRNMRALVGEAKWAEWGSEQVASNFLVANSPGAVVLPFETYAYYHPGLSVAECTFLHFIGEFRFKHGMYRRLGKQLVEGLRG